MIYVLGADTDLGKKIARDYADQYAYKGIIAVAPGGRFYSNGQSITPTTVSALNVNGTKSQIAGSIHPHSEFIVVPSDGEFRNGKMHYSVEAKSLGVFDIARGGAAKVSVLTGIGQYGSLQLEKYSPDTHTFEARPAPLIYVLGADIELGKHIASHYEGLVNVVPGGHFYSSGQPITPTTVSALNVDGPNSQIARSIHPYSEFIVVPSDGEFRNGEMHYGVEAKSLRVIDIARGVDVARGGEVKVSVLTGIEQDGSLRLEEYSPKKHMLEARPDSRSLAGKAAVRKLPPALQQVAA
jgi:hypothetical protein